MKKKGGKGKEKRERSKEIMKEQVKKVKEDRKAPIEE